MDSAKHDAFTIHHIMMKENCLNLTGLTGQNTSTQLLDTLKVFLMGFEQPGCFLSNTTPCIRIVYLPGCDPGRKK